MIKKIKTTIKKIIATCNLKKSLINVKSKKIIFIGSPLHGNVGDHAISIAIMDMLKKWNLPVVEIPGERYMYTYKKVINYVTSEDIIILTGGGLIGSLWLNEEEMIKSVLANFKNNKVIIMPHTIFFDKSIDAKIELEELKKIVNEHEQIYIAAREENTFKFCQKHFPNAREIVCLPDVVLTLEYCKDNNRSGILLVLRDDKEKAADFQEMTKFFENKQINRISTVLNKRVTINERKKVFEEKLAEFQKAELVITDRLHGMVFAAITGTPCIAFDNKSKKVSGVYRWLEQLTYIKFCYKTGELEECLKQIKLNCDYDYNLAKDYTKRIVSFLKKVI